MNNFKNNSIKILGVLFFLGSVMACDPGQIQSSTSTVTPTSSAGLESVDSSELTRVFYNLYSHAYKTDKEMLMIV